MAVNETVERIVYEGVDKISPASASAESSVKSLRQGLDGVKDSLAAVGVVVGAGALVTLYKQTLNEIAALDDMSEAIGASVENLSAIQRVAKVGGHDFEGLTGQISRMVKGLREGTDDGSKTAQALAFLDIKARDVNGRFRDTGEILVELAKKLETVTSKADRNLLVQDALGKGAERYIPLLKEIAEGTDLVATVTGKQAEEAEKAEKAIRRSTVALEDSRKELVTRYAPAVADLAEQLTMGIKLFGGFWSAAYNIGFAIDPFKDLATNIREINEELRKAQTESSYASWQRNSFLGGPDEETLKKRLEFLKFMQRQEAMKLATPDTLDARDRWARQPVTEGRAYDPGVGFTPEEIRKRQQDVIDAAIRANNDRDKIQKALNPFYMTDEEKEKVGAAVVKQYIELRDDVNAKIARYTMAPTMDEDAANPERDARLVAFRQSLASEEQMEVDSHQRRMALFSEFTNEELTAYGGRAALMEGLHNQHQARLLDIEQRKHQATRSMEMSTASLAAGLLQQFAGKSKGAALAVIAISKGLHIAQTIQSTAAAVMRAYSDLGPIAGTPAAAYIKTLGAIQVGLIAATGLVEAGNLSGGGGGAIGTFPANPNTGMPAAPTTTADTFNNTAPQVTEVHVHITGMVGTQQFVDETVIPAIRDAVDNRDFTIIGRNSRQAAELAP